MSYDSNTDQLDPNKKDATSDMLSSGGDMFTGGSGQSDTAKPTSSGSWTNLLSYLDSNSDQGAKMGQDVANTLNNEAQNADLSIKSSQSDFGNQLNSTGASLANDKTFIDQTLQDPTKIQDSDISKFQNDMSGNYSGPKDLSGTSGWATATSNANKAAQDIGLTGSESGRMGLLQNQYARPDYNQGEQRLDQMLVETNPDAQKSLVDVSNKWGGINSNLNSALSDSQQQAQQRIADTKAANDYATSQLNNANTGIQTAVQSQTDAINNKRASDYAQAQADLAKGVATPDEKAALGLQDVSSIYDLDMSKYLNPGQVINNSQAASSDQYANYLALAKLAGTDPTLLTAANETQAGQIGNGVNFDTARFQADLAARKAGLENEKASIANDLGQSLFAKSTTPEAAKNYTADNLTQQIEALRNYNPYPAFQKDFNIPALVARYDAMQSIYNKTLTNPTIQRPNTQGQL